MTKELSSRRRRTLEILTTAIAVVGVWLLPHDRTWVIVVLALGVPVLLGVAWWRLRHR